MHPGKTEQPSVKEPIFGIWPSFRDPPASSMTPYRLLNRTKGTSNGFVVKTGHRALPRTTGAFIVLCEINNPLLQR